MTRVQNRLAAERRKARHYGVQALYKWHMTGGDPQSIVMEFHDEYDFSNVDLDYFEGLLHSIPTQIQQLDDILKPILDRKLADLDPVECAVLRLATFELLDCPDVPYRVVISEAVSLAKKFGATDSHKYVNGVLDQVAKILRVHEKNF